MLPLFSDQLPTNADDLARMLEQSLRLIVDTQGDVVAVVDKAFPKLQELRINLDGAQLRTNAPRPSAISGETKQAFRVENFALSARGIRVEEIPLDLSMQAANLQLHQARDRDRRLVLVFHAADSGSINVSVGKMDLEKLTLAIATREAEKHGVAIEDLKLSLNSAGPRAIEGTVQLLARKSFFRGTIRIAARLEVDEKLVAKVSGLSCTGDGAIGNVAAGMLRPHLQSFEGRELNLTALPLGEISLRHIEIVASEKVEVSAQFGPVS
jgi:hypothetical protein